MEWSTFWDNFIPRYGGPRDDSQTGKGLRHGMKLRQVRFYKVKASRFPTRYGTLG